MKVALELVPTLVGMLSSDIPQGTVEHTRDGVSKRLSSCSRMVRQARTRWQNKVHVNVDYLLFKPLSNTKLGPMAIVGSSWGHGPLLSQNPRPKWA